MHLSSKRTIFRYSILGVLVFALLSTAVAQSTTELRATVIPGASAEAFQAVIDLWNEANPDVQVIVEVQPDATAYAETAPTTMFAGNDRPDLSWWFCSDARQFGDMAEAGLLAPLDDLYEEEGWLDVFDPSMLDYYLESDGSRYGVNVDLVWVPYIFYNRDMFEEVGVEVPTTWEELYAVADALREAGYQPLAVYYPWLPKHTVEALMTRSLTEEEYRALSINWRPDAPEESLEHSWTDPNAVRIFQTIREMIDRGLLIDGIAGQTDYDQTRGLFTSGVAAMHQDGSWDTAAVGVAANVDFEWGYFYYPPFEGDPTNVVSGWPANCFIVPNGDHVDAAKDVLAFIMQPENLGLYASIAGNPPGRTDVPTTAMAEAMSAETIQIMEDAYTLGAPVMFEAMVTADVMNALRQSVEAIVVSGVTPEEAARMMQDAVVELREG